MAQWSVGCGCKHNKRDKVRTDAVNHESLGLSGSAHSHARSVFAAQESHVGQQTWSLLVVFPEKLRPRASSEHCRRPRVASVGLRNTKRTRSFECEPSGPFFFCVLSDLQDASFLFRLVPEMLRGPSQAVPEMAKDAERPCSTNRRKRWREEAKDSIQVRRRPAPGSRRSLGELVRPGL